MYFFCILLNLNKKTGDVKLIHQICVLKIIMSTFTFEISSEMLITKPVSGTQRDQNLNYTLGITSFLERLAISYQRSA
jgi:hypothetical protein